MISDKVQHQGKSETRRFRGKLASNLMAVLIPLTIIPTFIMGLVSFIRTRTTLIDQISEQLNDVLLQETYDLDNWLIKKQARLSKTAGDQGFLTAAQDLIESQIGSDAYETSHSKVLEKLRSINPSLTNPIFSQFMLLDINGTVLAATKSKWEGLDLSGEDYFSQNVLGSESAVFFAIDLTALYPPNQTSESGLNINSNIIQISSYQLFDNQDNQLGYIIGISDVFSIQSVLETNSGYLPESKIFLYTEDGDFIGMTTLYGLIVIDPSEDQNNIIQGGPNPDITASAFKSYNGEDVFGLYDFYSRLNIGILVEAPQSKVFSQINSLVPFFLLLVIATILVIAALIFLGTQRFTKPILKIVTATQKFASGEWESRTEVARNDEIGLLAYSFNQMAEDLSGMYQSMEYQVSERTHQIITAAEIARMATGAPNLEELLNQAVELITDRFDYYHAAIFLIDEASENALLRAATGTIGRNLKSQGFQIPLDTNSIVGWVATNNLPHTSSDVYQDPMHLKHEMLPETVSEVGIPISIGNEVLGVLDVQSENPSAFQTEIVEILATFANQLASAIQNIRLLEGTEIDLQQVNELYRASRRIAQANSVSEILIAATRAIQQTTFISALYTQEETAFRLIENPDQTVYYANQLPQILNISPLQAQSYLRNSPIVIRDIQQPTTAIHSELLAMPEKLGCQSTALLPFSQKGELAGLIIIGSRERGIITQTSIQPFASFSELISTALEKVSAQQSTRQRLDDLELINNFSLKISDETDLTQLYALIYEELKSITGEIDFYIALYDSKLDIIEIPYLVERGNPLNIDPFPLGEGLSSIVVRTRQPLMLVENTEQRAKALGAKIVGRPAKSWIGIPLIAGGDVVGIISLQDIENEHRFTEDDLVLLTTLAAPIAGALHSARLLEESEHRAIQLQTAAEIARDTSATLERSELLNSAINLVRERFNFYHASVFITDNTGEYAVVEESTGEAGRQMVLEKHKLAVGSRSIIGYVTNNGEPFVVNDVSQEPTHRFNPLLPDTRAEVGIPIKIGEQILGALDVQSTAPYSFSPDDVEILQILADQLAVAITNAELFSESQEHLAQHRLIHRVTNVAASSSGIEDALSSVVQGLRVTLGDRVSILLFDPHRNILRVEASSGYDEDTLGLQIQIGQGITGWVAEKREPLLVNDVLNDPRYIAGNEKVRSELSVPLTYREELIGVLNIESDELNAFDEHDQDILGTLAGSLSAIIVNARLTERQRQLFEVTSKIRRSAKMETILETTANELSKVLRTRRTRINVGGELISGESQESQTGVGSTPDNGQEGEK